MSTTLPDDPRLIAVRQSMLDIGYSSPQLVTDYQFAVTNGQISYETADLVAFADPYRLRLSAFCTSTIRTACTCLTTAFAWT